ncbi:GEVED domain-containing protein [Oceanihabitans sediminis]|uniref:GEVED domain-containing protein n=1 Tax=Oceanihabitans sediminis TaxID=1812012 RepID=UPI003A8DC3A7
MKKITMLFFVGIISMLTWTSSFAQSTPCSQETLAGAEVENGFGSLHSLIFANDLVVDANSTYTLNTVQFNVLVEPGVPIDGVKLHFYKDSDSGTGPGVELSSTTMQVPTSSTYLSNAFGFDLMEVSLDLASPFTFIAGSTETVFWIGVTIDYSGASSYMEVVAAMNTPNVIYFLSDGTWIASSDPEPVGFGEAADGVVSFFGDCDVITACTGVPDAGTAIVDPTSGNPGSAYTVSAQGYSATSGMSFQWQSNTNSQGWVDEGTASNEILAYNAAAPSVLGDVVEWRLVSTCTASGETVYSSTATFTTTIQYCDGSANNTDYENITNVTYAGINNSSTSHLGYNDFTSQVATVGLEETSQLSVQITADGSDYVFAFIDWNQNGVLDDAGEVYTLASGTSVSGPHTMDITVPADAALGNTRMRVKVVWDDANPDPCGVFAYGEVEDYTVLVEDPTASIDDNSMLVGSRLYPNPLNDTTFYIHAPGLNGATLDVSIVDMTGRQVYRNTLVCSNNQVAVSTNEAMTSGVYIVTLKHASQTKSFRLVRQ